MKSCCPENDPDHNDDSDDDSDDDNFYKRREFDNH